jgi:hypothetical protein
MPTRPFTLYDKIYGKVKITSPVILELINSKPLQRLKHIGQFGVPDEFYHLKNYSRYDHSIGVFIILKKLGASEEEQVAGLLHDISHTAFSHVVDWVIGEGDISENYQDTQHESYVLNSNISSILKKYKFDPHKILNHKNYPLLERDIPQVCADRLDYSLKEFPIKIARKCFAGINATLDTIVFNNKEVAFLFAGSFLNRNIKHWGGYEAVTRYRLFANVLKIALKEKIISFSDFQKDDSFVVSKLLKSQNKKINRILDMLRNKSLAKLPKGKKMAWKKFRHVDPLIYKNGRFLKLSDIDPRFQAMFKRAEEINKKGVKLPKITDLQ